MYKKAHAADAPKKKNLVVMTKSVQRWQSSKSTERLLYKTVDPSMKTDIRTKIRQMKKPKLSVEEKGDKCIFCLIILRLIVRSFLDRRSI